MDNKTDNKLHKILDDIYFKIEFLSKTQMIIVDKLSKEDSEFQMQFIAMTLANDEIRNDFTEFLNEFNAPDKLKTFMMELNEIAININKEEE